MLIVCPTCANEYTIETDRIGPTGRVVRCAACRGAWFVPPVEKPEGQAVSEKPAADPDAALRARLRASGASVQPRRPSRLPLVATIGLAAALALAVGLRSTVVKAVPESEAAFAAIGLPVNLVGLQIGGVTSELADSADGRVLLIHGEIVNDASHVVRIPPLALTIEGEPGEMLYTWSDRTDRGELPPHDRRRFQAKLSSPPPDGRRVTVSFSLKAAGPAVASR